MLESLGWTLQVLGLIVGGAALLVGVAYGQIRLELGMLGAGAGLFLLGRWIQGRSGG